ncbi:MAG: nucleotidyltransferase family protein [Desulfomonilaceae bacterium]
MQDTGLPFTALILAGGLGKRLRSVVSDRPKPMAMVRGAPFLEILIDSLAAKGVRQFVLLTGHKGEAIADHFGAGYRSGIKITLCHEDSPLGTGGAVKNAEAFVTDPSLLVNGDTFFDADLKGLLKLHMDSGAEVTLSLFKVEDVSRYGSVVVDRKGMVTGFREKDENVSEPGLINAGLSLLSKRLVSSLPRGSFSMEREIFPSLVGSGKMFGLLQERPFFDIGTPESYEAFKLFMEDRRKS